MSLVANWRLQENSGTTAYDDAGANNGTSANTIVRDNGGMLFNGTSDFVSVTDPTVLDFTGAFTIVATAKFDTSGNVERVIHRFGNSDGYHITKIADDTLQFSTFVSGQATSVLVSDAAVTIGERVTLAMTRDGSNVTKCYVNGVEQASNGSITGAIDTDTDLFIGRLTAGGDFMSGTLSDIQFYDEALSVAEIYNIANPLTAFKYITNVRN